VNEPLTTARLSALYGIWYPHARDGHLFTRALVNQCRATVLAMEAIRKVNPDAKLVQTEDLAKTHSTPFLAYQAEHENERRWASLDLLTGTLTPESSQWAWFTQMGYPEAGLEWFLEHPCPPDVLGLNHYLSGERFLDHRIERYPEQVVGGNYVHEYADVLAARVLGAGPDGPERLLREAWERFGLPIAITEAHNGCTREEQLRWLDEVWRAAVTLREEGVDIRAVTVWSVLGTYGWADLLSTGLEHYESGVFDLRAPRPRPTALAAMTRALARGEAFDHPVLEGPGWWRRPERLWYEPEGEVARPRAGAPRPLLIAGATGTLGRAFARSCAVRGLEHRLLSRGQLDVADPDSIRAALDEHEPWAVVNATGYVRVDDAEREQGRCFRENADGPAFLAGACAERGLHLVTFSSDLVFDGTKAGAYVESDAPAPLNVYGRSKAEAEARVAESGAKALVARTSAFFGPRDEHNFVAVALRELAAGRAFAAADDQIVSPTYVPDLVEACLDLLIDGEIGIWHLANAGAVTWAELARLAAARAGLDAGAVEAVSSDELGLLAPRPSQSVLASERAWLLPELDSALARFVDDALLDPPLEVAR
jgi:dTDP-4-dehydrorhamnose reductase